MDINNENLIPFSERTPREHKKLSSKGGKVCAKVKREKKSMKEQLKLLLSLPLEDKKLKAQIKKLGIEDTEINNQMAMTIAIYREVLKGNTKAYEIIRDTIGEKPIDRQEIKEITTDWFK